MKQALMAIGLLIGLTACATPAESYEGSQEIVRALEASDISCQGLEIEEPSGGHTGHESLIGERGVCRVDEVEVTITTFEGASERDDWLAVAGLVGPTVHGPNWAVSSRSEEIVDEIARALNASSDEA